MNRTYILVSGAIFGVIALLQALRALTGLAAHVGDFDIPVWASWVAAAGAAGLCAWAFRIGCHCARCDK